MNTIKDLAEAFNWAALGPFIQNMLLALGILILGWMIARWADRFVRRRLGNAKGLQADDTFRPLIATTLRYAILLGALYAALDIAGVAPASLLAVFGAAGLAIALAIQGTLSNIAAGLMLIFLRSIKVGEYIQTPNVEGSILEIGLFTTEIKTSDGIFITVPNAQIWASQIKNYSRYKARRIDIDMDIARDNDLEKALEVLQNVLINHEDVINTSSAAVIISGFKPNSVTLQARCWLKADHLRDDASKVRLALHQALQNGKFKMPPILVK